MPTKKKTAKRSKSNKKLASNKPPVKAPVALADKPADEPVAARRRLRPEIWAALAAVLILVAFFYLSAAVSRNDQPDSDVPGQSSSNSSGGLRVVPEQSGSTASAQASGTLQPQSTGLQQAQHTTQSAGGLNLQAQPTPNQTTIR